MIGSIISAILWFLFGAVVGFGGLLLFAYKCYEKAGIEFFESLLEDKSDEDTD